MAMTEEYIRLQLGLEPRQTFRAKAQLQGGRQLGRTTDMMVRALAAISRGERLQFIFHNYQFGFQILNQTVRAADHLGLNASLLSFALSDRRDANNFYDHHFLDMRIQELEAELHRMKMLRADYEK